MVLSSIVFALAASLPGTVVSAAQPSGPIGFDEPRFSFTFTYDVGWIPVKFSGLYDSQMPYWDGFQHLVKSFRFKDAAALFAPRPSPTPMPPIVQPTPGPVPHSADPN